MAAEQAKIAQQASQAGDAPVKALAHELTVIGSGGKALSPAERERLVRQLGSEGSAALLRRHLAAMASTEGVELYAGNEAKVLVDGPATFDAMFKAIAAARRSVLVESYIVEDAEIAQRLADALIAKRRQGVQVALLYDGLGSFGTDDKFFDRLRAAGVGVCAFNPVKPGDRATGQTPTHRDHRKIVTVDRLIGFTGGINISAVYSSGSFGGGGRKAPAPPKKKEGK
ncbi:MAG: phospholipase D-like domain-containing protein, partial [Rubrivivax sp.]